MRSTCGIVAAAALLLWSFGAQAELVGVVNDIRSSGCKRRVPAATRVVTDATLDAAAGLIARGSELDAALIKSGFRATSATSINLGGVSGDAAIREVLADGFCDKVNNAAYTAIGTYARDKQFWIVLAERFEPVTAKDASTVAQRVLALVALNPDLSSDASSSLPRAMSPAAASSTASFATRVATGARRLQPLARMSLTTPASSACAPNDSRRSAAVVTIA